MRFKTTFLKNFLYKFSQKHSTFPRFTILIKSFCSYVIKYHDSDDEDTGKVYSNSDESKEYTINEWKCNHFKLIFSKI